MDDPNAVLASNSLVLNLFQKGILHTGKKVTLVGARFKEGNTKNGEINPNKDKIEVNYNGIFPAAITEKLGRPKYAFKPVKLKNMQPGGGDVGLVDVIVLEKSPLFQKDNYFSVQVSPTDHYDPFYSKVKDPQQGKSLVVR